MVPELAGFHCGQLFPDPLDREKGGTKKSPGGGFYYQRFPLFSWKLDLMRWNNSWMAWALSELAGCDGFSDSDRGDETVFVRALTRRTK